MVLIAKNNALRPAAHLRSHNAKKCITPKKCTQVPLARQGSNSSLAGEQGALLYNPIETQVLRCWVPQCVCQRVYDSPYDTRHQARAETTLYHQHIAYSAL
jgi:hypothetical protein